MSRIKKKKRKRWSLVMHTTVRVFSEYYDFFGFQLVSLSVCLCRGERRFEKPLRREGLRVGFEEVGSGGRKEYMRSDSDNWRTLREEHEQEEAGDTGGSWRLAGPRRDGIKPTSQISYCVVSF